MSATDFCLPSLGADMDEGTIVEWRVGPGDEVHKGDIVAVVSTEKSDIEIESWHDATVEALLIEPGVTVAVGTPIARFGPPGGLEDAIDRAAESEAAPAEPAPTAESTATAEPTVTPSSTEAPSPHHDVHSPLLRRRAAELGVDLDGLTGTGVGGTITRADVEAAARPGAPGSGTVPSSDAHAGVRVRSSPYARLRAAELGVDLTAVARRVGHERPVQAHDVEAFAAAPPVSTPLESPTPTTAAPAARHERDRDADRTDSMRQAIARLMARSKREIPHYYLEETIDLAPAMTWLAEQNAERPVDQRLLPAVILLKAVARAVRKVPSVNGFWIDDRFQPADGVHVGVAISLRTGGLVAPAIHDLDSRSLDDAMAALRDLVERARAGRIRAAEMSDPTITVTNLGEQGAEVVHGVITPPQVALVGFGRIVERPWAVDGMLAVHPVVRASLAVDHRANDGRTGSRFLTALATQLAHPDQLT